MTAARDAGERPLPATYKSWARRLYAARYVAIEKHGEDLGEYNRTLTDPEQEVVARLSDALPLNLIGVGAGRITFEFTTEPRDDEVIKFARWGDDEIFDGKQQNGWEIGVWTAIVENDVDERLLPLQSYNDAAWWVTQPKVTPLDEDASIAKREAIQKATELRRELFSLADYIEVTEVSTHNTGFWNGQVYLFDYGRPPTEETPMAPS